MIMKYWRNLREPSFAALIRCGQYKAHVWTRGSGLSDNQNPDTWCRDSAQLTRHDPPLLYNLDTDPGATRPRPGCCLYHVSCHAQGRDGTCPPPSPASPRRWGSCWPPRPPRCTGRPVRWPGGTSQQRPPAVTRCQSKAQSRIKLKPYPKLAGGIS